MQVLADAHGNTLWLGERDCSAQRRHQKLIEESPAPNFPDDVRRAMGEAAVKVSKACGYVNAGTVEFLYQDGAFFFLEMNTRLQVEHPVTELVTGLDLVEWQLRVADGERIDELRGTTARGHAVEVRLYAEDPRTFLPQAGRLDVLRLPETIRVDAGVAEGDEVGTAYDPMIAKLIAHAPTRDEALDRLRDALAVTEVRGVTTNLPFLRWLVAHPVLRAGDTTTAFLVEHPPLSPAPPLLAAAPWRVPFRLNLEPPPPAAPPAPDAPAAATETGSAQLKAPMPGTVIRVLVAAGDHVEARQPLVVLEAMKMETPLTAPYAGRVRLVHVTAGDRVAGGAVLLELGE
jgi:acetyl/propionyl-CoA carboxylase alpha subunit